MAECFGEAEIPADQEAEGPERCFEDCVRGWQCGGGAEVGGAGWAGGEVWAFGVPEVGFGVGAENFASVGDEGADVEESWFGGLIGRAVSGRGVGVGGDDGAGDDADAVLFGQGCVSGDVVVGCLGQDGKLGVVRDP